MQRREFLRTAAGVPALAALAGGQTGADRKLEAIALPKPQLQGGKPLMQTLNERKTNRDMSEDKLSPQVLSNLFWAAFGVNRPATGGRTAPSAMNVREMDLYAFLPDGVYVFDAVAHALKPVVAGDQRAKAGTQAGVAKAPLILLYVADMDKFGVGRGRPADPTLQFGWSSAHAGFIGQNVYLFAASEGLATCFRASLDAAALTPLLGLRSGQKILYCQTVGYPAKKA